ncbi:FecR/PupR family sigma factor regulator [Pseudomonas sp. SIMBA_077]
MGKNKVDPITRAAIDWVVCLESGHACPSERQVFKAWLAESPEHKAAWLRVAGLLKNPLPDTSGHLFAMRRALLGRTCRSSTQAARGVVVLLLLLFGLGGAGLVD